MRNCLLLKSDVWKVICVRHGSHQGWKSTRWTQRCIDLLNNLGFSLCAVPPVCYMVATSDGRKKSKMEVSADLVCCHWTPEIEFNKNLSLLIIRLVNYSVITSLSRSKEVDLVSLHFLSHFYFYFLFIFYFSIFRT